MRIIVSGCKVGGQKVTLVAVDPKVLMGGSEADRYIMHLSTAFPDSEIVLYADDEGKAKYYGRSDLVDGLGQADVTRIPWQEVDVDL